MGSGGDVQNKNKLPSPRKDKLPQWTLSFELRSITTTSLSTTPAPKYFYVSDPINDSLSCLLHARPPSPCRQLGRHIMQSKVGGVQTSFSVWAVGTYLWHLWLASYWKRLVWRVMSTSPFPFSQSTFLSIWVLSAIQRDTGYFFNWDPPKSFKCQIT